MCTGARHGDLTVTIKKYPAPISLTSLTCLMGTLQAAVMTLVLEHKASSRRLNWDIRLLAPIYSGIMIFGVTTYVQTLVIRRKGPVFTTAFRPLSTIIVAVMGLVILEEALHLGDIAGSILIFLGLYMILWGKKKEKEKKLKKSEKCDEGIKNGPPITKIEENIAKT
ncbi:hypothetical protein HHK36_032948 [Tetracentron sinense]|uniref:WAT1-related protein n=1 Tax=Tetracentron sinense TaxID=13715 RepID=A0A834Y893_TETSI|nr:hypothetical protein HHK36_032948 [Tetracentron sinense]